MANTNTADGAAAVTFSLSVLQPDWTWQIVATGIPSRASAIARANAIRRTGAQVVVIEEN